MIRNFQLGTSVAIAYGEGGFLGVQTDGFGENSGVHGRDVIGQFGLIGRPLDASEGKGALTLFADEGAEGFAWVGYDCRDAEKWPELSSGSVALVNSKGAWIWLDYEKETIEIKVPMDDGENTHVVTIGKDESSVRTIKLTHSDGMTVTMRSDGIKAATKDDATVIEMTTSKIEVKGPTVHVNSPNVLLGEAPGAPVARVGDIVSVAVPAMIAGIYPVIPLPPGLPTSAGGVLAMGQIISGGGAKA